MKNEYKKALIGVRNYYIDLSNKRKDEIEAIYEETSEMQMEYLDKSTFNLISSNNRLKNNVGNFIAYRIFKRKTYKNLLYIVLSSVIKVQLLQRNIEFLDNESEKIMNTIDFINSVSETQLNNYLKYKIN